MNVSTKTTRSSTASEKQNSSSVRCCGQERLLWGGGGGGSRKTVDRQTVRHTHITRTRRGIVEFYSRHSANKITRGGKM